MLTAATRTSSETVAELNDALLPDAQTGELRPGELRPGELRPVRGRGGGRPGGWHGAARGFPSGFEPELVTLDPAGALEHLQGVGGPL
jgi:hypothetical protein